MTANREARRAASRAAKRPPARTIDVQADAAGVFAGWDCTARADFPAGTLVDLSSGDLARIIDALGRIVIRHNFPDERDQVAATLADVDPYDGLMHMSARIFDGLSTLPNR